MTRPIAVLIAAMLTAPALAARTAEPPWIELKSSSMNTIVVSNGDEADARRLLTAIERIQQLVRRALGDSVRDDGEPLIVVAPRDGDGMRELVGDSAKRNRSLLVAASLPSPYSHYLAVNLDARQSRHLQLLQHEYLHQVTQTNVVDPPAWLDEGLSEFWSTLVVDGNDARVGSEIAHHMRALRTQRWIPLAELVAIKRGDYDKVKGKLGLLYAESWLLVHYLTTTHAAPRPYVPVLPADLASLEKRLKAYVASALPAIRVPLPAVTEDAAAPTVRALGAAESLARRASAILYSDGQAAATLADRALSIDKAEPLALEVKGISYFLSNQAREARKWLELAVSSPAASFRAHYYCGIASVDTPEVAQKHFRRALELKPGFEPALQRLHFSQIYARFLLVLARTSMSVSRL